MQALKFFRRLSGLSVALALVACGTADNPYSKLPNPPLVSGKLHVVTLVSDAKAVVDVVSGAGWQAAALPPNYPQAEAVQAGIWGVPEPVATGALHFRAGQAGKPDLRVLLMPLAARGRVAEADINEAFFRNVLGVEVPAWPLPGAQPDNVRIQAWTYLVPDIVDAARKLRSAGIPLIYDPVRIVTSYMGDHKTMAIRAPDGTVVQLVQASLQ